MVSSSYKNLVYNLRHLYHRFPYLPNGRQPSMSKRAIAPKHMVVPNFYRTYTFGILDHIFQTHHSYNGLCKIYTQTCVIPICTIHLYCILISDIFFYKHTKVVCHPQVLSYYCYLSLCHYMQQYTQLNYDKSAMHSLLCRLSIHAHVLYHWYYAHKHTVCLQHSPQPQHKKYIQQTLLTFLHKLVIPMLLVGYFILYCFYFLGYCFNVLFSCNVLPFPTHTMFHVLTPVRSFSLHKRRTIR